MRNANPRDGEIGRSWGRWFHKRAERSTAMAHVFQRMDADDARIRDILRGNVQPAARLSLATSIICPCGCKGDPFICIEADGS